METTEEKQYEHIPSDIESYRGKLISFDFAIKYLLRDKGNYDIIEGFISALLKEQGHEPVKIVGL
ncbi:hypothetical protein EDM53_03635, partial [Rickettsiales endosymbiont of Peranema trichophorum]|uniref:hypothetical protein n=1 Tax=Rickettsiales endosymbiont of Peranema trichophorum TaxID=2486577 RepID=UPI001022D84D